MHPWQLPPPEESDNADDEYVFQSLLMLLLDGGALARAGFSAPQLLVLLEMQCLQVMGMGA